VLGSPDISTSRNARRKRSRLNRSFGVIPNAVFDNVRSVLLETSRLAAISAIGSS